MLTESLCCTLLCNTFGQERCWHGTTSLVSCDYAVYRLLDRGRIHGINEVEYVLLCILLHVTSMCVQCSVCICSALLVFCAKCHCAQQLQNSSLKRKQVQLLPGPVSLIDDEVMALVGLGCLDTAPSSCDAFTSFGLSAG